jgi:hypothetical protein
VANTSQSSPEEAREQVELRMSYSGGNGIFVEWPTDREHLRMAPAMPENIFGKLTLIE